MSPNNRKTRLVYSWKNVWLYLCWVLNCECRSKLYNDDILFYTIQRPWEARYIVWYCIRINPCIMNLSVFIFHFLFCILMIWVVLKSMVLQSYVFNHLIIYDIDDLDIVLIIRRITTTKLPKESVHLPFLCSSSNIGHLYILFLQYKWSK